MTTTNNQLPIDKQPNGDLCIPVSIPNNQEWLWLLAKCLSFPTAKRFWVKGSEVDIETVRHEWDSRVYNPVVEKIINADLCAEAGEDDCLEYPTNHGMIDYQPMNPFSDAGTVPDGYLLSPFVRYADLLLEDLPDWLADLIAEITGEFTGYEPNDVLSLIGSFPLDLSEWQGALTNGLPRFAVTVQDKGTLELHFVTVPFGGRALITVDVEPNLGDIFTGIISGDVNIIELARDLSSIPPEINVEQIHEVTLDTVGEHIIHVTFVPAVNDEAIPISFGGGLRSVVWCSNNIPDVECPDCDIETVLDDEEFFEEEYVPATFGTIYENTVNHITDLETAYDDTPQSIGANIPAGVPDDEQKYALCGAIKAFLQMYAAQKIAMIQSRNFIQIAWDKITFAATQAFDSTTDLLLGLFGFEYADCAIDSNEAITALSDDSAIDELQCELLDLLDGAAITETLFNDSIDVLTLLDAGNAQIIACMLSNDNNLQIYLMFLEIYNNKLISVVSGGEIDCECISQAYRLWVWNFATQGLGDWIVDWSGSTKQAREISGGIASALHGSGGDNSNITIRRPFDPAWRVHGARMRYERTTGGALGMRYRLFPNSNTSALNPSISNGLVVGGEQWACQNITAAPTYITGINEFFITQNIDTVNSTSKNRIYRLEILFVDGFAPTDSIPYSDSNLCD